MKKVVFFLPAVLLFFGAIFLIIHSPNEKTTNTKIKIVTAENFWGNIAMQIAGDQAQVVSIISDPNQDPHQYDSTSNDAKNISEAAIVIENGLGYDAFMQKILATTHNKSIINIGSIAGLQEGDNPHLWYNIQFVKTIASTIRDDLISKDSIHVSLYNTNYNTFIQTLQPIETICQDIKISYTNTPVLATERIADYMLSNCGLNLVANDFQKAVEEGTDPSVQSINFFRRVLNNRQVKMLLYNEQTVSDITNQMQSLAKANNIPVVGVTETMPLHTDYQNWMLSQLQYIQNALQNGS